MAHRDPSIVHLMLILLASMLFVVPVISLSGSAQELDEMDVGDPASIAPLTLPPLNPCPDRDMDVFERLEKEKTSGYLVDKT